jgi:hypothetical protein
MWSRVKKNRSNLAFFALHRQTDFLDFSRTKGNKFLNSIFTKILKMKSSFFGFLFQNLKISNLTDRFSWKLSVLNPCKGAWWYCNQDNTIYSNFIIIIIIVIIANWPFHSSGWVRVAARYSVIPFYQALDPRGTVRRITIHYCCVAAIQSHL